MACWLVLGGGSSGLGAAQLLRHQGFKVVVSDQGQIPSERRAAFELLGVRLCEGPASLSQLAGIDGGLVVSPGVPFDHPYLIAAQERGLSVVTEIDLALAAYHGTTAAVTGTNGKSTTVAMLGYLLNQAGLPAQVAGNIGTPPSQLIATGSITPHLVLELSSYQLALSQRVAPRVAIITSFTPDHLARHSTLKGYLAAKWRVLAHQGPDDLAIIAREAWQAAQEFGFAKPVARLTLLDQELADSLFPALTPETELAHNRLNATAAVLAASHLSGQQPAGLCRLLTGFRGLAHRCEKIGTIEGRPVYNDSKATNVASTLVALQSQRQKIVLLLGGQGKGESFAPLLAEQAKIARVIAFGPSGQQVVEELGHALPCRRFPRLADALEGLRGELAAYPHGVLFSPACASFDEFSNFEERGRFFTQALGALLDPSS